MHVLIACSLLVTAITFTARRLGTTRVKSHPPTRPGIPHDVMRASHRRITSTSLSRFRLQIHFFAFSFIFPPFIFHPRPSSPPPDPTWLRVGLPLRCSAKLNHLLCIRRHFCQAKRRTRLEVRAVTTLSLFREFPRRFSSPFLSLSAFLVVESSSPITPSFAPGP